MTLILTVCRAISTLCMADKPERSCPKEQVLEQQTGGIHDLPADVLSHVFSYLPGRSLARAAAVCRQWRALASVDALWKGVLSSDVDRWPAVEFSERNLRSGPASRPSSTNEESPEPPWHSIFRQRSELPRSVVVDAGSGYCKFGWSDQEGPSGTIATFLEVGDLYNPILMQLELLYSAVFTNLRADPTRQPIIISESLCFLGESQSQRREQVRARTLGALFDTLGVPAVCLVDQATLALYSSRRVSGMAVNIGFRQTTIVPVLKGQVVRSLGVVPLGLSAMRLTARLSQLLEASGIEYASMFTVRTLKEELCFVARDAEGEAAAPTSCLVRDEGVFTLREERFEAPEILFQPRLCGLPGKGLHQAVADHLQRCAEVAADTRSDLSDLNTVVLAGGTASLPGLPERMEKELRKLLPGERGARVKVVPTGHGCHGAWYGAKLISNTSSFLAEWCVTREKYQSMRKVT